MASAVVSSSACLNLSPRSFKPKSLAFELVHCDEVFLQGIQFSVDVDGSEHDRGSSNCDAVRLQPHVSTRVALNEVATRNTSASEAFSRGHGRRTFGSIGPLLP